MHLAQVGSPSDQTHRSSSKGLEISRDPMFCAVVFLVFLWFPVCMSLCPGGIKCPFSTLVSNGFHGSASWRRWQRHHTEHRKSFAEHRMACPGDHVLPCSTRDSIQYGSASVPKLVYWIYYWIVGWIKYEKIIESLCLILVCICPSVQWLYSGQGGNAEAQTVGVWWWEFQAPWVQTWKRPDSFVVCVS